MPNQHEDLASNEDAPGVAKGTLYPPSIMYKLDETQFDRIITLLGSISLNMAEIAHRMAR